MVERLFDYLTLSCLTTRCISVEECLDTVLKTLRLAGLWERFELVGRSRYYALIYRYNDISVKICEPERLASQGICIEFTGNGLAYYQSYLKDGGLTLRRVLKAWRALSVGGIFTRVTRIDHAMDEIRSNGDTPFLTMSKINNCVKNHEFTSRLRVRRGKEKNLVEFDELSSKAGLLGSTTYFGNRRSVVYCRFYDKLLEQRCRKLEVDESVTSWVRCEFEFKDARAMAVVNAYCDMTDDAFAEYMSSVVNNYVSFINRDDVNVTRCSLKKWWAAFLGIVGSNSKSKLVIPPYKPVSFSNTSGWLRRSVFPTLCRYILCVGFPAFFRQLSAAFNELENAKTTFRQKQMMNDFKTILKQNKASVGADGKSVRELYNEHVSRLGLEPWAFTSSDPSKAVKQLQKDYDRYVSNKGSEWDFDVLSDSYTANIQLKFEDFPPESIFGADGGAAYSACADADIDDWLMEAFAGGDRC